MNQFRMLRLKNLDEMFAKAGPEAVLLNTIDYTEPDYAKKLADQVFTRGNDLDFVASCDCGQTTGNYYLGTNCPHCNTTVGYDFSATTGGLEHRVWIGIPPSITGILHPTLYLVLADWLKYGKKGTNYIDAICDMELELPLELHTVVDGRGYNYFQQHFDRLMDHFLYVDKKTRKHKNIEWIAKMIQMYRHMAFVTKVPILARVLHSATPDSGSGRRYVDSSGQYVLGAVIDLARLKPANTPTRQAAANKVLHRMYKAYAGYLDDIARRRLGKKLSLVRRHLFGTRLHWTFRAVIIPITGEHCYDHLYLPWSLSVNLLKEHLIGRLTRKYKMTLGDAVTKITNALYQFDELINKLMCEFIEESPFPGLPVIFTRAPSIESIL